MKKFLIGAGVTLALLLTGCATQSNPADLKSVHYSGGEFSAKKYKDCLDPSTRSGYDPGDTFPSYPVRQISYEASAEKAAERGRFTVVSSDNAELLVPVRLTFRLDAKCETLRQFHETLGARYNAAISEDKNHDGQVTSADFPSGWVDLLNDVIGKPLDNTLIRIAQKYPWREVWNSDSVRLEMQTELQDSIEDAVNQQAGGDFFTGFTVLVQKPDPKDEDLVQAISDEQAGIAQANAAKAKADADVATAKAQTLLAEAQAKAKQAEIQGYGGIDAYLRHEAIEAGQNPFQPSYGTALTPTK